MYRNSHFYKSVIFLLTSLIVLGCSVGKNYKRPELHTPQQYSAAASGDSSIGTKSWKQFFVDTTLKRLIDQTLANNFNLQLAIKRMEVSQQYAKQARLAWLPTLNAVVGVSTNRPSENSLNGLSLSKFLGTNHLEDYTAGLNLSWEIDIWGKIRRQKEAALATYLQSYEASRAVQTALVAQVAHSYYNLLMMDAQLKIANSNVLLSDSVVQMMQLQKTAGEVTELAVQQAITQKQNAALLVPQLEQAMQLQENAIHLLSGEWPGFVSRSGELATSWTDDTLSLGIPADLLSLRPDVRANERALMAANARVGIAQANMYPALNLTAAGGLNAFKASNWFVVPASLFGTAAGGLLQPVFQRRLLKTQRNVAVLEREQRVIEFRQSVLTAAHEVTNAMVKLDKLKIQQQVANDRVELSEKAVNNARMLFRSGLANYLEVITAQSRALQAELDEAAIVRQLLSARVELYQSLGGGWR